MADEVSQILAMLGEGKITAGEAEKLINALRPRAERQAFAFEPFMGFGGMGMGRGRRRRGWHSRHRGHGPRFLRIIVDEDQDGQRERINIKVPLKLLRAGISLGGLMPREAKEKISEALKAKGIDFDPFSLAGSDADEIVEALSDLEIDLDGLGKKIRIHVVYDDDGDGDDGHGGEDGGGDDGEGVDGVRGKTRKSPKRKPSGRK